MECLFQGLRDLLCLAAIKCEALLCLEAATLSGFRVFLGVSFPCGHGALLASVGVFCI
jgi:hypothetical protein